MDVLAELDSAVTVGVAERDPSVVDVHVELDRAATVGALPHVAERFAVLLANLMPGSAGAPETPPTSAPVAPLEGP